MEKRGVGRPRDGNPEETRREILRAAGEAFAESGFVGATTRTVAARAGVNVATLHYHFGSKERLYRAVFENASGGALPAIGPGPEGETVASLVEALFEFGVRHPLLARLALLDRLAGPPSKNGGLLDPRVRWLAEALRPILRANGSSGEEAESTARSVVALVDATFLSVSAAAPPFAGEEAGALLPPYPGDAAREAVVAAARRLSGLG